MIATCAWCSTRNWPTPARPIKAIADVRSMLKGGPEDREVYLRLGIMYTRAKQWKEAEEALEQG